MLRVYMQYRKAHYRSREVQTWLNVQSVKKLLTSVMQSAIPIEDPTKCGRQTSNLLRLRPTAVPRRCMYVLLACVLV